MVPHVLICHIWIGSGKTSIIHKLINHQFNTNTVPTTLEHHQCLLNLSGQDTIKLSLWDFGGCEKYEKIRVSAISSKNTNKVAVIVYDVSEIKSFEAVAKFVQEWNRNVEKEYMNSIVLVANKIDLEKAGKRVVSVQTGVQFANKRHLIYTQCSAKANVQYVFELAYYLKLAQTPKQGTIKNIILSRQCQTNELQKQSRQIYHSKQASVIRDAWESKMALVLYRTAKILKKLKNNEGQVGEFHGRVLTVLKNILIEAEQLEVLKHDSMMLEAIQSMTKISQNSQNQQHHKEQQEYLSPNTIPPTNKRQQSLGKLQDLLKNKINLTRTSLTNRIAQEAQQMKQEHQKISKNFDNLYKQFQEEGIINFLNVFDGGVESYEEIGKRTPSLQICNNKSTYLGSDVQVERGQSYQLCNNKLDGPEDKQIYERAQSLQISNNIQAGREEERKILMAQIKQQCQNFHKLQSLIRSLHTKFNQFTQKLEQEYNQLQKQQEVATNLTQIEVYQSLLAFYVKGNIEQINPQGKSDKKQAGREAKYAENKAYEIGRHLLENYEQIWKQTESELLKLMELIIVGLDRRRKVKISRQQCRVLNYWVAKRKSEISTEDSGESKIISFFSRIFA